MKFKSGDRVRCINNKIAEDKLIINKIYIIDSIMSGNTYMVFLENDLYAYGSRRFELAYIKEFSNKLESIINEEESI